jgi:16S rRNA (guanine527-N7)-methyltransferase
VSGPLLRRGLKALGVSAPGAAFTGMRSLGETAELLERFLAELDRWNVRFGFVKAAPDELVTRHVLDSLAGTATIARLCAERAPAAVLDAGSGAGFPGIPLAVALPAIRFTLLERSEKKCAFLDCCRAILGLGNVTVVTADLASASGAFDVVTFRAVAPLQRFLADLARSRVAWRSVAAYKGRRDRIDEELAALGPAARSAEVVRLAVPFVDEERHLVVLRAAPDAAGPGAGSARNLDNGGVGD